MKKVKQRCAYCEIHKEVNVTIGTFFTASNRPKDSYRRGFVTRSDQTNLIRLRSQLL